MLNEGVHAIFTTTNIDFKLPAQITSELHEK